MKKILTFMIIFILLQSTLIFAYSDQSKSDALIVLNAIKEIRFNTEAGVDFNGYHNILSKATVEYRKYIDKYPNSDKDVYPPYKLSDILEPYQAAYQTWYRAIYERKRFPDVKDCNLLFMKWPVLQDKIPKQYTKDKKGNSVGEPYYLYGDIMKALWSISADNEKIADNDLKQTPGSITD